jgi:hypothetical protein
LFASVPPTERCFARVELPISAVNKLKRPKLITPITTIETSNSIKVKPRSSRPSGILILFKHNRFKAKYEYSLGKNEKALHEGKLNHKTAPVTLLSAELLRYFIYSFSWENSTVLVPEIEKALHEWRA